MAECRDVNGEPVKPYLAVLSPLEYDAWAMSAQMLSVGHSVTRLPGGAVVDDTPGCSGLSCVGVAGPATTFGGMSLSRRMAANWLLLDAQEVPTPQWKAFNAAANKTIDRFADAVGYPVVVSRLKGGSSAEATNYDELLNGLRRIRRGEKPHTVIVRKKYGKRELRLLLAGDKPLLASNERGGVIQLSEVHDDFQELARRALHAVPGLQFGEVIIDLDDPGAPATNQDARVAVTNFAPALRTYKDLGTEGHLRIARNLLQLYAERQEIVLPDPQHTITADVICSGLTALESFQAGFEEVASELGCEVMRVNAAGETATFTAAGTSEMIALLVAVAMREVPGGENAHLITVSSQTEEGP